MPSKRVTRSQTAKLTRSPKNTDPGTTAASSKRSGNGHHKQATNASKKTVHRARDSSTSSGVTPTEPPLLPTHRERDEIPSSQQSGSNDTVTYGAHSPQEEAERCGHAIHPAYADRYKHSLCPLCLLDKYVTKARRPILTIIARGGATNWRDQIASYPEDEATQKEIRRMRYTTGSRKKYRDEMDKHDRGGRRANYPQCKLQVLRRVAELEQMRREEVAWQAKHPVKSLDQAARLQLLASRVGCASRALYRWDMRLRDSLFGKIDEQAASFSRKRGREMEVAARPDFPEPDNYYPVRRFSLTQEQKDFIAAANAADGEAPESDSGVDPPKSRRRRVDMNVEFDSHTYIRQEADVDLLFKAPTNLSADFLEDATRSGAVSVTRTSTVSRHMHPLPTRPYLVKPLADTGGVGGAAKTVPRRQRYLDGRPGYDTMNTSGHNWSIDNWEGYTNHLETEANEDEDEDEDGMDDDEFLFDEEDERAETRLILEEMERGVGPTSQDPGMGRCRHASSPGQQEMEAQVRREAEPRVNQASAFKFRPHGGMASAFALAGVIGGTAVAAVRKAGWW